MKEGLEEPWTQSDTRLIFADTTVHSIQRQLQIKRPAPTIWTICVHHLYRKHPNRTLACSSPLQGASVAVDVGANQSLADLCFTGAGCSKGLARSCHLHFSPTASSRKQLIVLFPRVDRDALEVASNEISLLQSSFLAHKVLSDRTRR